MMKTLKMIGFLLCTALLGAPEATAQRADKNLWESPYFLKHAVGQQTLQECWVVDSGLSAAQVEVKYQKLFDRFNGLGWTDAQVLAMTTGPAAHNDWMLRGQGGGQPITGRITSNNGTNWPEGVYAINYPCIIDGGDMTGKGTGFSGSVPGIASMNTNLVYDHARWIGGLGAPHYDGTYVPTGGGTTNIVFDVRNVIQATTWGMLTGSNSYSESGTVDGFRLSGNNGDWWNPAYTSNGLALWDPGETYKVGRIFAETFNGYGVVLVRGTPATFGEISSFQNALGGLGLIGTELNTINVNTLSGDDNPAMIVMISGYGRNAGGAINVNLLKSESGKRTPNKGQIVVWQRTPCYGEVHISTCQADMNNLYLDAPFVMNSNSGGAGNSLTVDNFRGWNLCSLVHDVTLQKGWAGSNYRPESFKFRYANGSSTLIDAFSGQLLVSRVVNASDRLGITANNTCPNYVNGTPLYNILGTGTPTPVCDWILGPWGPWGTCTGGLETRVRTVDVTIPLCTPVSPQPPATETQVCGTPPVTCVWNTSAWSVWSTCVASQQTRTRTANTSVAGCVPTDPVPVLIESQSCIVIPPPPTGILYSTSSPFNNASVNTTIDIVNVAGVNRITLTNVTFQTLLVNGVWQPFNYQKLLITTGSTTGIRILPDGKFRMPNGALITMKNNGATITSIVPGVQYSSFELVLPATITVDRLFSNPGAGAALLLTSTLMQFHAQ